VDSDLFNRDPEIAAWMAKRTSGFVTVRITALIAARAAGDRLCPIAGGINASDAYGYFTQRVKAMGRRVAQR
jgi:GDP-D-mannose dehydratase